MAGGRPPKPTEVKLREGNAGKRKLVDPVEVSKPVTAAEAMPFPSDYLPPAAATLWKEIIGELIADGILRTADKIACVMMTQAAYDFVVAEEAIQAEGYIVHDRHGQPKQNPWVSIRNEAMRNYKSWCERFGLTPSDRTRLGIQVLAGKEAAVSLDTILGGYKQPPTVIPSVVTPRPRGGQIAPKKRSTPRKPAAKKPTAKTPKPAKKNV